ncbi:MAG: hypothetical protein OXC14_07080 [Rhodospirillaceae bacterium]|nr:hypothetical protein [Rhodospirillaceae bacterium]
MKELLLEARDDIADILNGKKPEEGITDQQAYLEITYAALRALSSKLGYVEQLFYDKYPD